MDEEIALDAIMRAVCPEFETLDGPMREFFSDQIATGSCLQMFHECLDTKFQDISDLKCRPENEEEMFLKYDVPNPGMFESQEAYVEAVNAFMGVWREEVERGRERGDKCLIDWLQKLDRSGDVEKRATAEDLRVVAANLGVDISFILGSYFLTIALSAVTWEEAIAKVEEICMVLRSLRVAKNSVVIERFLEGVKFTHQTLKEFWIALYDKEKASEEVVEKKKIRKNIVSSHQVELNNLLHLILKEVLRLEVAFCCPDLPMMLTNEVYVGMGDHLRRVFAKNLEILKSRMEEFGMELNQSVFGKDMKRIIRTYQLLQEGLQMMWCKLELKPIGT